MSASLTSSSEQWWRREIARQAYVAGWKQSRGCESFSGIQERTMESRFERWWDVNFKE
jgi:hypothetical protein